MSSTRIQVGDRLPDLRLPRAGDERTVRPLRGPHRDAAVVVVLHDPACDACVGYLQALADAAPDFGIWDGSVRAVVGPVQGRGNDRDHTTEHGAPGRGEPGGGKAPLRTAAELQDALGSGVDVLVDTDRAFVGRVPAASGPVTVVADRYGQVYHVEAPGGEAGAHAVMEPRELEEWLKYLATQCPE